MNVKTIVDYLKEHGKYVHDTMDRDFSLELHDLDILLRYKTHMYQFMVDDESESFIQEILELHGIEIRFCEECGKPFDAGFMADGGFWYCCEDCFDSAMDESYGKGKWRGTEEEGEYGGFYECLNDDGEWEDTSIYYTEWY
jgi:hypothetical protein